MPAQSKSQATTARVALQVKRGKMSMSDIHPAGFRKAVQSMQSMTEQQLQDFSHTRSTKHVMQPRGK